MLPPLTLSEAEAREGIELLNKTASEMEAQKAASPARVGASGGSRPADKPAEPRSADQVRRAEGVNQ
jgi:hypothetical protein